MMDQACESSTPEVKAGEYQEFEVSLGYTERPCLKNNNEQSFCGKMCHYHILKLIQSWAEEMAYCVKSSLKDLILHP